MGFIIGVDQRQHINLTHYAWRIIEMDMFTFVHSDHDRRNISGFLNHVFKNFVFEAKASLFIQSERYTVWLDGLFQHHEPSPQPGVKKILIDEYVRDIQSRQRIYEKGTGFKFRLNNENYRFLVEESQEDAYYKGASGLYLKALFEEYVRLPYHKRESIYFSNIVETVHNAIESHRQIRIETLNDKTYFVSPYRFTLDRTESFNYLIGYVQGNLVSFRLFKIASTRLYKSKPSKLTKDLKKEAESTLRVHGPQFLAGEVEHIVVYLTDQGIKNYHQQIHMRPEYEDVEDKHYYHFYCPPLQILFYFFKFGRDATVIKPTSLRNTFIKYYENALENYNR